MRRVCGLVVVCAVFGLGCGATQTGNTGAATRRTKLAESREIEGYPCARGYAWFYSDGKLQRCTVSQETQFGEARISAGSIIDLEPAGKPEGRLITQMTHATVIAGVKCSGGNRLLGPSEGAMTAFYPSGKLEQCWLAGDQSVQGVPCMRGGFMGFFGDGSKRGGGANFYEGGKLKSCTLAKDFGGKRRGDRFEQAE